MSLVCMELKLELLSDAIFSSGNSIPGGEDIALRVDASGDPIIPGSTLKGLLRESMMNYLCWTNQDSGILTDLFGEKGWSGGENAPDLTSAGESAPEGRGRRIVFGDLRLAEDQREWTGTRAFTALEDGVVKQGTLRMAACLRKGLEFCGELVCDSDDIPMVQKACAALKWAGLLRHRGFGRISVKATEKEMLNHWQPVDETHCIRYRLELLTPMTIPAYSRSAGNWSEQNYTNTKKYLPGSAVRGLILSTIARERPEWFQAHKAELMGNGVRFLNAYPIIEGQAAIPTPMGFYEDKRGDRFYSVLTRKVHPQDKRADIGAFSVIDEALCLHGNTPKTTVSLRMKRGDTQEEKQVFITNSIAAGTVLEGYIQLDDPTLAPEISGAFYDRAWLGADKYAGNGLCRVTDMSPAKQGLGEQYSYAEQEMVPAELYMMLLSPASMTRHGDVSGIDEERLADLLELAPTDDPEQKRLRIDRCATSVTEMVSYNSTWGCAAPAEIMYEAGSVFCLTCSAPPTVKALRRLEQTGIGLRRSEGCGQVLFLKNYERYQKAPKQETSVQIGKDALLRRARCRWLLEHQIPGGLSKSQLGSIQVLCEQAIAAGGDRVRLEAFFKHNMTKRGARHGVRFEKFKERFDRIINTPLSKTLGVEACPDGPVERLRLICDWIDLSRKEAEE